jgi:hypothetical protein
MMKLRTKTANGMSLVKSILDQKGYKVAREIKPTEIEVDGVNEGELRLALQSEMDNRQFNFSGDFLLINGNSVYSYAKIKREVATIKRNNSTSKISKYFYEFMHLNFTIAHYNIEGWKHEYPTWDEVQRLPFQGFIPHWKTDVQRIVADLFV